MKSRILLLCIIPVILSSCGQKVITNYTVFGNNNKFVCETTASPEKTVGTSLGASVSATAAMSQAGAAENSGSSEAKTTK